MKSFLLTLLAGYVGLVGLMYLAQRSLMYFPDTRRTAPADAGLPGAEEAVLTSGGDAQVIVWHIVPRDPARPVFLYFHGNGGALRLRAQRFRTMTADGSGLVALSYRGYGGSSGSPSEAGLIADAQAAYAFAAARYAPERIVLFGESLGAAVAVALATQAKVGALVLEAPFTSAADVAFSVYPFVPVRLLMKDQFHSGTRIAQVKAPLLLLHGERDAVVPFAMGERLFALANEPKRFVPFARGGHEGLDAHGAQEAVRAFLRDLPALSRGSGSESEK